MDSIHSSDLLKHIFQNEDIYIIENKEVKQEILNEPAKKTSINLEKSVVQKSVEDKIATVPNLNKIEKEAETTPAKIEDSKKIIPLLILANEISLAEKVFLEKVLNAVNLGISDIELFTNLDLRNSDFRSYATGKTYQRIVSFGMPYSKIGISRMFIPYQIAIIKNIQFLMAEHLPVVENDIAHKRLFWACLKQMFAS